MKLVKHDFYSLPKEIEEDYKLKIERCARVAYKSEDKMTIKFNVDDDVNKQERVYLEKIKDNLIDNTNRVSFLSNIIANGHTSVMEHYRVCFKLTKDLIYDLVDQNNKIKPLNNPYIVMSYDSYNETIYISSNLRSYYEWYNYSDDLKRKSVKYIMNLLGKKYDLFFTFPKLLNDDDYMLLNYIEEIDPNTIEDLEIRSYHAYKTIMFVTNRGVSHEVVRHRKSSFTQESSRFCSYDKDKFGNEINFIDPEETINSIIKNDKKYATLDYMIQNKADVINEMRSIYELIEKSYMKLKSLGCPSDVARNVLPIGVKTEIAITQTIHWWREFLKLRTTKNVHPDFLSISRPLLDYFKKEYKVLFLDINY